MNLPRRLKRKPSRSPEIHVPSVEHDKSVLAEQAPELQTYQTSPQFDSILGSILNYLKNPPSEHRSSHMLTGSNINKPSAFVGYMNNANELFKRLDDHDYGFPHLAHPRNRQSLQKVVLSGAYYTCLSIHQIGALPVPDRETGHRLNLQYPENMAHSEQITHYLAARRTDLQEQGNIGAKNLLLASQEVGLDSPQGQKQFMQFLGSCAFELEQAEVRWGKSRDGSIS